MIKNIRTPDPIVLGHAADLATEAQDKTETATIPEENEAPEENGEGWITVTFLRDRSRSQCNCEECVVKRQLFTMFVDIHFAPKRK